MNEMYVDIHTTLNRYDIIYADPPWSYNDKSCAGAANKHYKTMNINDLKNIPINQIANDNCILFMWATYPLLPNAIDLIDAWGFTYKTIGFQWVKTNKSGRGYFFGLGRWTRGNTEPCLIAVKGKPTRESAYISQLIIAPVGKHSVKPPVVRDKITQLLGIDKTKIELFARNTAPDWDCWGNQAPQEVETKSGIKYQINYENQIQMNF